MCSLANGFWGLFAGRGHYKQNLCEHFYTSLFVRICMSNELPGDAAGGPATTLCGSGLVVCVQVSVGSRHLAQCLTPNYSGNVCVGK